MNMEQGISFTPSPKPAGTDLHFERRDWIALLGVLICSFGYAFLHPSIFTSWNLLLPGIGMTISCWLMLALCMGYIGWSKLKWSIQSSFLLISSLLLSATYGLFSNNTLRIMNLPILLALCVLAVYSMNGTLPRLDSSSLMESLLHALRSVAKHLPVPAFALRNQLKDGNNRHLIELLMGIGICIPVIGFVLLLLCNADSIFGSLICGMLNVFHRPGAGTIPWNCIRMLALILILFGFIYGLNQKLPDKKETAARRALPEMTLATILTAMSIVYAAFVYVQCRYLFAGSEAVMVEGGYAVYARTGFFQLVAVAFITMLIVLPTMCKFPGSRVLRFLCALVTLLTMVIIVSAFWRMRLYIFEFGLTFLRAVTLWGILAISAAMIATLVKAARPNKSIFKALFVFTIITWLAFNYANVHARIADYNLSAYRSGRIEHIDVDYLGLLGPEGLSALDTLRKDNELPVEQMGDVNRYRLEIRKSMPAAYDWSLSWRKVQPVIR